ncbi:hypothetical protein FS842_004384 [Serendipita sp. 407]|nr:hypothetical protein FS842_004384 [Serendipita sp. 407]
MAQRAWKSIQRIENISYFGGVKGVQVPKRAMNNIATRPPLLAPQPTTARDLDDMRRISNRYLFVDRFIRSRRPKTALSMIHTVLNQEGRIPARIRPEFYAQCINGLIEERYWDEAYDLYWRMKAENLAGVEKVFEKILGAGKKQPKDNWRAKSLVGDAAGELEEVGPEHMKAILARLVRQQVDIHTIRQFFQQARIKAGPCWPLDSETCSLMAQAEAQSGQNTKAWSWFQKGKRIVGSLDHAPEDQKRSVHEQLQTLYTRLIIGKVTYNPHREDALPGLFRAMKKDKVLMPRRLYNHLIAGHADAGRCDVAFTYYQAMRRAKPPVPGNHYTFLHLFSASTGMSKGWSQLELGGRRLFRDMTRQHLSNTNHKPSLPSNVLNTGVLNAALRYFMRQRDYAAATITVRAFPICAILPDKQTHSNVIDELVYHIEKDLLASSTRRVELWADRILGEIIRVLGRGEEFSEYILHKLLRAVNYLPSDLKPFPVDMKLLLALLRRAVLSSLGVWPEKDPVVDERQFRGAMALARNEMLPPKAKNTEQWFMAPAL